MPAVTNCSVPCTPQIRLGLLGLDAINAISDAVYNSPPTPPPPGRGRKWLINDNQLSGVSTISGLHSLAFIRTGPFI